MRMFPPIGFSTRRHALLTDSRPPPRPTKARRTCGATLRIAPVIDRRRLPEAQVIRYGIVAPRSRGPDSNTPALPRGDYRPTSGFPKVNAKPAALWLLNPLGLFLHPNRRTGPSPPYSQERPPAI